MAALWINAFVARETDAAYGVAACERGTFNVASNRFLWIPKGKVQESSETVLREAEIQMHGESVVRVATPMSFLVDTNFLAKVKADQYAYC